MKPKTKENGYYTDGQNLEARLAHLLKLPEGFTSVITFVPETGEMYKKETKLYGEDLRAHIKKIMDEQGDDLDNLVIDSRNPEWALYVPDVRIFELKHDKRI